MGSRGAGSQEPGAGGRGKLGPRGGPVSGGVDGDSASRDVYGRPVVEGIDGDPEVSV